VNPTSLSLLDRLRRQPTEADWRRLHDLYQPLIRTYLARVPGLHDEAGDLAQEVLVTVYRELAGFERQREGSFRAWLRAITVNRVRSYWRDRRRRPAVGLPGRGDGAEDFLDRLADPHSDLSRQWDADHDRHVFDQLLTLVRPDFTEPTWEAFRRFAIEGRPAAAVAAELSVSESAVFLAKSRVLRRLREEASGLID
jgi:RNA polymerase sigma-70 factor (ECF subfamily)